MNSFMLRTTTRLLLACVLLTLPTAGRSQSPEICDDTNLYAWDPKTTIDIGQAEIDFGSIRVWDVPGLGLHGYSPVAIADVWDEDIADDGLANGSATKVPDLIFTRVRKLYAVNISSGGVLWELGTNDTSGATSVSVFDFNGDGTAEIAYRDQSQLRIMYGGPLANAPPGVGGQTRDYASFPCSSATMNEGPTVADIDGDGSANLLVMCGGTVTVFESATAPWREARRVWWNQSIFVPGAVDERGRVYPVAQGRNSLIPEGSSRRPLNVALSQTSPVDLRPFNGTEIPALDAVVESLEVLKGWPLRVERGSGAHRRDTGERRRRAPDGGASFRSL
jgi:hypothetical protein